MQTINNRKITNPSDTPDIPSSASAQTIVYMVADMHCMSCVKTIESALLENCGVSRVGIDLVVGEVQVHFDPTKIALDDLEGSIKKAGYEVTACRIQNTAIAHHLLVGASQLKVGPYPYLIGAVASLLAIGFYLGFMTLTSDWYNARMLFAQYQWWVISLAAGLGMQVALFFFLKRLHVIKMKTAKSGLATSGGVSAVSMAACCAHYLVAFLPVLGLTFLSPVVTSLSEYQREFFALGLLANLFGIGIMLRLMEKSGILHFRTLINNLNFGLSRS